MKKAKLFLIIAIVTVCSLSTSFLNASEKQTINRSQLKEYSGSYGVLSEATQLIGAYSLTYSKNNDMAYTDVLMPHASDIQLSKGAIVIFLEDIDVFCRVMVPADGSGFTCGFVERKYVDFHSGLFSDVWHYETVFDLSIDTYRALVADKPSSWAAGEVNAALESNFVPVPLQSKYTQATTRAEFCALAVKLYETVNIVIWGRRTFNDTDDVNVQKAAAIGIVSGVGGNRFAPNDLITREQAAAMLARLADTIGRPLPKMAASFSDNSRVSTWAIESVGQMQAAGIMQGVDVDIFAPEDLYTREQSIVTIMRMYNLMLNTAPPVVRETDITVPVSAFQTRKWFDYYQDYQMIWQMDENGGIKTELPEYPGVIFKCTKEKVTATEGDSVKDLIWGWPVWNVYFADLNGDGFPELCATISVGSGYIDNRVAVYDYANDRQYDLSDRSWYDYVLSMEDGQLVVSQRQRQFWGGKVIAVGRLAIINGILTPIGIDRTR